MIRDVAKFYFESFLITLSAFLGAIVALIINYLWFKENISGIAKIGYIFCVFVLFLLLTLSLLYTVIYFIGYTSQKQENMIKNN